MVADVDVTVESVVLSLTGRLVVGVGVCTTQVGVPGGLAPGQGLNCPTISGGAVMFGPGTASINGPDP